MFAALIIYLLFVLICLHYFQLFVSCHVLRVLYVLHFVLSVDPGRLAAAKASAHGDPDNKLY